MITGEYPTVLRRSRNRDLLERAHNIIVSKERAKQIVYTYLEEPEVYDLRFTSKIGRGFCQWVGDFQVMIRLPEESSLMITLGLVLHEIAHGITFIDCNVRSHGDLFVRTLDNLISVEFPNL